LGKATKVILIAVPAPETGEGLSASMAQSVITVTIARRNTPGPYPSQRERTIGKLIAAIADIVALTANGIRWPRKIIVGRNKTRRGINLFRCPPLGLGIILWRY
jgi:hypothetical protein